MVSAELTGKGPEGSWLSGVVRSGAVHLLAILIGLSAAIVVALDHQVSLLGPFSDIGRKFPFLATATVCGLAVALGLLVVSSRWLFERRFAVAIIVVLVAGALSGLNVSRVETTDVALLLVITFWFVSALVERHPIRMPLPLLITILLLAGCSIGSIVNGGFGSVFAQRSFLNKLVLVLAVTSLVATAGLMPVVVRALPTLAVISAVAGIGSMIFFLATGVTLSAEDLGEYQHKMTPLGLLPRATGFMPTTQAFSHLLLLGLCLLLLIPMRTRLRLIGAGLIIVAVVCTFSTGAYVTLAVILLLFPFVRWPDRSLHFIAGLVSVSAIVYLSGFGAWMYETIVVPLGGKGAQDRIGYIQAGVDVILAHPVFGIGLRQIGRALMTPVHNAYIQLTAELGLIAGVLFAGMIVALVIASAFAGFRRTGGGTQLAMKGLFLGMVAMAVHFCFEPFYDNYVSWAYIGIVAGSIAGLSTTQTSPRSYLLRSRGRGFRKGSRLLGGRP